MGTLRRFFLIKVAAPVRWWCLHKRFAVRNDGSSGSGERCDGLVTAGSGKGWGLGEEEELEAAVVPELDDFGARVETTAGPCPLLLDSCEQSADWDFV
jgi:hypothetical protein